MFRPGMGGGPAPLMGQRAMIPGPAQGPMPGNPGGPRPPLLSNPQFDPRNMPPNMRPGLYPQGQNMQPGNMMVCNLCRVELFSEK